MWRRPARVAGANRCEQSRAGPVARSTVNDLREVRGRCKVSRASVTPTPWGRPYVPRHKGREDLERARGTTDRDSEEEMGDAEQ
jgi:hypothetical protein